jgi:hypothetical protein
MINISDDGSRQKNAQKNIIRQRMKNSNIYEENF